MQFPRYRKYKVPAVLECRHKIPAATTAGSLFAGCQPASKRLHAQGSRFKYSLLNGGYLSLLWQRAQHFLQSPPHHYHKNKVPALSTLAAPASPRSNSTTPYLWVSYIISENRRARRALAAVLAPLKSSSVKNIIPKHKRHHSALR